MTDQKHYPSVCLVLYVSKHPMYHMLASSQRDLYLSFKILPSNHLPYILMLLHIYYLHKIYDSLQPLAAL